VLTPEETEPVSSAEEMITEVRAVFEPEPRVTLPRDLRVFRVQRT